jgi:cation transport protein ChaC
MRAMPDTVFSQILASATGRYGTTRDYVEQTLNALRSHQMPDRNLEARFRRCHNLREV